MRNKNKHSYRLYSFSFIFLFIFILHYLSKTIQFDYKTFSILVNNEDQVISTSVTKNENYENKKEEKIPFKQPTFKNELIDTTKFNYDGECRSLFKYRSNNKRDLVFHSIHFKDKAKWREKRRSALLTQQITQSGIPNATRILFIYGEEPEKGFTETMDNYGVKVIKSDLDEKSIPNFDAAVYRFVELENYLKNHLNDYDRIVVSDFWDVAWFADGFSTFADDEFFFSEECSFKEKISCNSFTKANTWNARWVRDCYGQEVLDSFIEKNSPVINIGFVYGNMTSMLKFLEVYNYEVKTRSSTCKFWGFDQAIVNYIYNSGKLNELNITVNKLSQRFAFNKKEDSHRYDQSRKIILETNGNCSPIIRHKLYGLFK